MGVRLPVWQAGHVWNDAGAGHTPRFGHLSTARLILDGFHGRAVYTDAIKPLTSLLSVSPVSLNVSPTHGLLIYHITFTSCSSSRPIEDASPHAPATAPHTRA